MAGHSCGVRPTSSAADVARDVPWGAAGGRRVAGTIAVVWLLPLGLEATTSTAAAARLEAGGMAWEPLLPGSYLRAADMEAVVTAWGP